MVVNVAAPAPAPAPAAPSKFSKANLRRVALSALKAFGGASIAVVIAREGALAGPHLDISTVESIAFAAIVAGSDAMAKVLQVALED